MTEPRYDAATNTTTDVCVWQNAEAPPHLFIDESLSRQRRTGTRLSGLCRSTAPTASSVYGLTTMPGPEAREWRNGGNCVLCSLFSVEPTAGPPGPGLAGRHAVAMTFHSADHLYSHTNTVVSTRYTTCIYAHTSRVRAHGSFRA